MLRYLASEDFPPFGTFQMTFPEVDDCPKSLAEVHLLTGVNGTGKSRLLCALAALLGNPDPLLKRSNGSLVHHRFSISNSEKRDLGDWFDIDSTRLEPFGPPVIGQGLTYQILSQTPAFAFSGAAYLTDAPITAMADVPQPDRVSCLSFSHLSADSKSHLQMIANLKIQSAMDGMPDEPPTTGPTRSIRIVQALESTLSEVAGQRFRFHVTSYPKTSLRVVWGNTTLAINQLPDGLRSLIGWLVNTVVMLDAWLQGVGDLFETECIFLLDEIEAHLHPTWQRRILPAFQRLFPRSQIFCATHSPFLISSLNHGWIHPLTVQGDGKVANLAHIKANEGDSYVSVLEEIMGLKEWYDPETETLLANFRRSRDEAYRGNADARGAARELAGQIGKRSLELSYMMGQEMHQMDRRLSGKDVPR